MKLKGGFTLIELLVGISIIGLLSSVVLASLNSARIKARDVRKLSDLRQIYTALELYNHENGHYPIITNNWSCFDCTWDSYLNQPIITPAAASIRAAISAYMPVTPKDPKWPSGIADAGYLYYSNSTGSEFKVMAWRTPENMNNFSSNVIDSNRCGSVVSGQCSTGNNTIAIRSPNGDF